MSQPRDSSMPQLRASSPSMNGSVEVTPTRSNSPLLNSATQRNPSPVSEVSNEDHDRIRRPGQESPSSSGASLSPLSSPRNLDEYGEGFLRFEPTVNGYYRGDGQEDHSPQRVNGYVSDENNPSPVSEVSNEDVLREASPSQASSPRNLDEFDEDVFNTGHAQQNHSVQRVNGYVTDEERNLDQYDQDDFNHTGHVHEDHSVRRVNGHVPDEDNNNPSPKNARLGDIYSQMNLFLLKSDEFEEDILDYTGHAQEQSSGS